MMRVTENADFFSGLPRQTAQQMVKQSVTDFKNITPYFALHHEIRQKNKKAPDICQELGGDPGRT